MAVTNVRGRRLRVRPVHGGHSSCGSGAAFLDQSGRGPRRYRRPELRRATISQTTNRPARDAPPVRPRVGQSRVRKPAMRPWCRPRSRSATSTMKPAEHLLAVSIDHRGRSTAPTRWTGDLRVRQVHSEEVVASVTGTYSRCPPEDPPVRQRAVRGHARTFSDASGGPNRIRRCGGGGSRCWRRYAPPHRSDDSGACRREERLRPPSKQRLGAPSATPQSRDCMCRPTRHNEPRNRKYPATLAFDED